MTLRDYQWENCGRSNPERHRQRAQLEEEFGHSIIRGGGREHITLRELKERGLQRKVNPREAIAIGPCECGD